MATPGATPDGGVHLRRRPRQATTCEGLAAACHLRGPQSPLAARKGAAGLRDYRFHDNRHTAATRVLRASGNLNVVKRLLRHEDIATTVKYAHSQHEDVLAAMENAAAQHEVPTKTPAEAGGERVKAQLLPGLPRR